MIALVTGASSGIGLIYAHQLAEMGHDIIAVSNQEKELEDLRVAIEAKYSVHCYTIYKDLTSPTAAQELLDYTREHNLPVEILINNAGVFFFNYLIRTPLPRIELMLNLHVLNTTRMTRLFGEEMASRGHGYILNMSSSSCWMKMPGIQCYNATKAYINNFSRSMWHELHPLGVNVLSVTPGAVDTGLYGLSMPLRRLAVALRVSITPERLVKKALYALFHGRKRCMPGLLNYLYLPFVEHCPDWIIRFTMKKIDKFMHVALLPLMLLFSMMVSAQKVEPFKFGNFDTWTVRYIKESKIIGGNTKEMCMIGPRDTIRGNALFEYGKNGNPWSCSNAYAKVSGVEKVSVSAFPERRGNGYCARLEVINDNLKALGVVNIKVLVTGTLYTGRSLEPISDAGDPCGNVEYGMPFTRLPKALLMDYKCKISPDSTIVKQLAGKSAEIIKGVHDRAEAFVLLQKRWETPDGRILALRVGTVQDYFDHTVTQWQNQHRMPFVYGEDGLRIHPLETERLRAINSKGKLVPIEEIGAAEPGTKPTHAIVNIAAGCCPVYMGHPGNILWVDNVAWEF